MDHHITQLIEQAISEQIFPGCVVGYIAKARARVLPFGHLTYKVSEGKVKEDTIYDVASITKAIPTSSLALALLDQHQLSLGDPVGKYIPELVEGKDSSLTIFHLLTQTLSWDLRLSHLKDLSADELWLKICTARLKEKPGTSYAYSNATSILLSQVIQEVSGSSLDLLAQEYFFEPLEMKRTTFHPSRFSSTEIAPTEIDSWRGKEVRSEVHDESAYVLRDKMIVGSAGLFSTVPDVLRFVQMLLAGGKWEGNRYVSESMLSQVENNQIEGTNQYHGLGWELNQPWYMGKYATAHTFGKTGFTGCHVMIDRKRQKAVILLSNSTYPKRPKTKERMNHLRRELSDIILRD